MTTTTTKQDILQDIKTINKQFNTELMLGLEGEDAAISLESVARITKRKEKALRESIKKAQVTHPELTANFSAVKVEKDNGQTYNSYTLDRKAFYYLVLGMNNMSHIRLQYINAFEAMRELILSATEDQLEEARSYMTEYKLMAQESECRAVLSESLKREAIKSATSVQASVSVRDAYKRLCNTPDFKGYYKRQDTLWHVLELLGWVNPKGSGIRVVYQECIDAGFMNKVPTGATTKTGKQVMQIVITPKGINHISLNYISMWEKARSLHQEQIIK